MIEKFFIINNCLKLSLLLTIQSERENLLISQSCSQSYTSHSSIKALQLKDLLSTAWITITK